MSKVFFTARTGNIQQLFDAAELSALISPGDQVALKIHFGEPGNTAYLKPEEVGPIAEQIKQLGGRPFFTDANTLYQGPRHETKSHLEVARRHGFSDVIISEENDQVAVPVNLKHFKQVYLAGAAMRAPVLLALTHFKGHDVTGFGGTLKNLGMGLGTRKGKLKMHSDCKNCLSAPTCRKNITLESCWVGSPEMVQEKMAEYAFGAVQGKKAGFINYLMRISPNCDCYDHNGPPIVPDLGVLCSLDPVAVDQASADLVNRSGDKFRALYPRTDWSVQLKYAEAIGMGSRKYELIKIDR